VDNFKESISKYGIYFEELRRRFFLLLKIFVIIFIIGFISASPLIKLIMTNFSIEGVTIIVTTPFQLIHLAMSIGFLFACIITVPIFVWNLYHFLRSGLLKKERKLFILAVPLGILLFVTGFLYGGGMLYYGVKVIAKVNINLGIANYWDITTFFSQIVLTSSLLGLLFLFPLVITFLIRLNIIDVSFLKSKRRHAIVVILVLVSLLPPTDGLSLILMALPLVLIYELTILFNRNNNRGRHLLT